MGTRLNLFVLLALLISLQVAQARQAGFNQHQAALGAEAQRQAEAARFTLEVRGLGVSVQKLRQSKLWQAIRDSPKGSYLFPEDPAKYPWYSSNKAQVFDKREGDAMEFALRWGVERQPIPNLWAWPACHNPKRQRSLKDFENTAVGRAYSNGACDMIGHKLADLFYQDDMAPVLEQVFGFFEEHPEVPEVLLVVEEGAFLRNILRAPDGPYYLNDQPWKKTDLDDAIVALLFARADRVEALKATAPDKGFFHRQAPFKPTEFLPKPWTLKNIADFELMPVLGRVMRPQYVSYRTPEGAPMGPRQRQEAFQAGWRAALDLLPEGLRPARILYDCGPGGNVRLAPLAQALHELGPDLELSGDAGIDLTQRMGDTGSASPYVGLAVGLMASYDQRDVSAAVSLRGEDGASIFLVLPPTTEELKKKHPSGGPDPFVFKQAE